MDNEEIEIIYPLGTSEAEKRIKTFIRFVQTAREVAKYIDARLYEEAGISMVKFIALHVLSRAPGALNPNEIAKWTRTERNNITTLIRRMQKDGLVTVERNTRNKKYVDVTITEEGREILALSMAVAEDITNEIMQLVSGEELEPFSEQLYFIFGQAHSSLKKFYMNKTLK